MRPGRQGNAEALCHQEDQLFTLAERHGTEAVFFCAKESGSLLPALVKD
jgi:hypothetical protein